MRIKSAGGVGRIAGFAMGTLAKYYVSIYYAGSAAEAFGSDQRNHEGSQ